MPPAAWVTQVVSGLYKGFFIQDVQGDGDAATSDGSLFVYTHQGQRCRRAGAEVCVSGKVKEYFQPDPDQCRRAGGDPAAGAIPVRWIWLGGGESLSQLLERHEGCR